MRQIQTNWNGNGRDCRELLLVWVFFRLFMFLFFWCECLWWHLTLARNCTKKSVSEMSRRREHSYTIASYAVLHSRCLMQNIFYLTNMEKRWNRIILLLQIMRVATLFRFAQQKSLTSFALATVVRSVCCLWCVQRHLVKIDGSNELCATRGGLVSIDGLAASFCSLSIAFWQNRNSTRIMPSSTLDLPMPSATEFTDFSDFRISTKIKQKTMIGARETMQ